MCPLKQNDRNTIIDYGSNPPSSSRPLHGPLFYAALSMPMGGCCERAGRSEKFRINLIFIRLPWGPTFVDCCARWGTEKPVTWARDLYWTCFFLLLHSIPCLVYFVPFFRLSILSPLTRRNSLCLWCRFHWRPYCSLFFLCRWTGKWSNSVEISDEGPVPKDLQGVFPNGSRQEKAE